MTNFSFQAWRLLNLTCPNQRNWKKQYPQENTSFYNKNSHFSMASCPATFFLLKKEKEMTFGSNTHLCYFFGSSHRGEHEVLQVNLLQ